MLAPGPCILESEYADGEQETQERESSVQSSVGSEKKVNQMAGEVRSSSDGRRLTSHESRGSSLRLCRRVDSLGNPWRVEGNLAWTQPGALENEEGWWTRE